MTDLEDSTRLRPATAADLPALVGIEAAAMRPDAWSRSALADELADELAGVPGTRTVLVVDEYPGPAAYGVLRSVGGTADVQRLVVDPTRRRRGLGSALLEALLHAAETRGCSTVLLEVAADNAAARGLYAAHGFEEIDRRRGYYSGGRDALVLSRPPRRPRPYGEQRA